MIDKPCNKKFVIFVCSQSIEVNSISRTYRFIALTLALLMFTTSVGFAMDMHYCGGKVKSVSFIGKAKDCQGLTDATAVKSCAYTHRHQENNGASIAKKKCCENKTFHFQADQDREIQTVDYTISTQLQQVVAAFVIAFFAPIPAEEDKASFSLYKPPLIPKDIPVLIQSFLL